VWVLTTQICNPCDQYSPTCPTLKTLIRVIENLEFNKELKEERIKGLYPGKRNKKLRSFRLERNRKELPNIYDTMEALQDVVRKSEYTTEEGECPHKSLLKGVPLISYVEWIENLHRNAQKIKRIKDGTVIDHIRVGYAFDILRILRISGKEEHVISAVSNVDSRKYGTKDLIMLENRLLTEREENAISLISLTATINIIEDGKVKNKIRLALPDVVEGLMRCYPSCISSAPNSREPITTKFLKLSCPKEDEIRYRCYYCGRDVIEDEILGRLIL
jgi:aspartate carbamoyltransferase regulatory subunit